MSVALSKRAKSENAIEVPGGRTSTSPSGPSPHSSPPSGPSDLSSSAVEKACRTRGVGVGGDTVSYNKPYKQQLKVRGVAPSVWSLPKLVQRHCTDWPEGVHNTNRVYNNTRLISITYSPSFPCCARPWRDILLHHITWKKACLSGGGGVGGG